MDYEAIVIGTGFGATIAATRLAALGKKTLLIERGTWWITPEALGSPVVPKPPKKPLAKYLKDEKQPVQYWARPDHRDGLLDFFAAVRSDLNEKGLYQYSIFDDAHVITANGVGGGSLIYSNVTLRPEQEVLNQIGLKLGDPEYKAASQWMEGVPGDPAKPAYRGVLNKIVTKIPLPGRDVTKLDNDSNNNEDYLLLDRSRVMRDAAKKAFQQLAADPGITFQGIKEWEPLDLAVLEYDPDRGANGEAIKNHTFCERQGRCFLGCLPAARHTLNKTIYNFVIWDPKLDQKRPNVTLMPLAKVLYLKPIAGGYEVRYEDTRDHHNHKSVTAPQVFLGGGTMGTTEILLRSLEHGLKLSQKIGQQFSSNGDFAGFAVGTTYKGHPKIPDGTSMPVYSTRGPINTVHLKAKIDGMHVAVEDCAIPSMFADLTARALEVLDNAAGQTAFLNGLSILWKFSNPGNWFPPVPNTADPKSYQTEAEKVSNILFFNAMGQDKANGKLSLKHDQISLDWNHNDKLANSPVFNRIEKLLQALAQAAGGQFVPFPMWKGLFDHKIVVVHPLGGCPIGATNSTGVVDEFGRVFDGSKPPGSTDVLPGLFVVDGSSIPGALVANPSLTIAAQAVKTVAKALP
jgi:cholesterol oxidase